MRFMSDYIGTKVEVDICDNQRIAGTLTSEALQHKHPHIVLNGNVVVLAHQITRLVEVK